MNSKKHFKSKAFTLLEVSAIIIIIGIMIVGTLVGSRIIAKSRLAAAESLARSSPILGIKDNMLWLETSLKASIDDSQASDGSLVTSWYDQGSNVGKSSVVAVGTGPTYANTINHVHAIKFVGSTANYLQISDASFLNNTDYTIMVLEKRQSGGSNNYFIGETSSNPNDSLALGYSSDSTVIHAQGSQSYNTSASVSSYASSSDKPRQFTFVHSAAAGNSTYINGILAAQDTTKTAHLSGVTSLAIGKGYTGEIGEIAIFARALEPEESQSVEDYIGKKWTRSINRSSAPNGSCVGYTITDSGCDLSSATCNISQTGISATVAPTSSSTPIACNQANYFGNVSYTCIGGVANVVGSCVAQNPCTSVSATGSTSTISSIAHGASGNLTCNATNYTGTATFTCSNGTTTQTASCTCVTGYVGSGCSTCDTANNYVSGGGGTCVLAPPPPPCTVSGITNGTHTKTTISGFTVHTFLTTAAAGSNLQGRFDFTCPTARNVEYLIVGGGGGSGGYGGGGGAGGFQSGTSAILAQTYTIFVGSGGNGESANDSGGSNGKDSSFNSIISKGGGFGRHGLTGNIGGSGGGNGYSITSLPNNGTPGQGNSGGKGLGWVGSFPGAGGGGAGGQGGNVISSSTGGTGGLGMSSNISGTQTTYAVGGPGATRSGVQVTKSPGGSAVNEDGANGTGNGAGAGLTQWVGKKGGGGVVIIRYN